MYSANVPIYSIAACDSGQSLAVAGNDGSLLLLQIDPNSSKMALQQARHLVQNAGGYNGYDDGPIVDMHPLDPDSQSVIIYATLYGAIICWDLRMPTNAWRLNSDLKQGVITTFCIDSNVSWLATGTSHGNHICWDLRFKLPIGENEIRMAIYFAFWSMSLVQILIVLEKTLDWNFQKSTKLQLTLIEQIECQKKKCQSLNQIRMFL